MRKILYALFIIFIIHPCHADTWREQIQKCDVAAEQKLKEDSSTIDIVTTIQGNIDCHKNIAYKIIDNNYSINASDMKKDLDTYVDLSGSIAGYIQSPDECYPQCGTIVGVYAAQSSLEQIKKILDMLISGTNI